MQFLCRRSCENVRASVRQRQNETAQAGHELRALLFNFINLFINKYENKSKFIHYSLSFLLLRVSRTLSGDLHWTLEAIYAFAPLLHSNINI